MSRSRALKSCILPALTALLFGFDGSRAMASAELGASETSDKAKIAVPDPARVIGEMFEGVPRLLRDLYGSEVFFNDLGQSYFLSREPIHNDQYQIIQRAIKEGRKIKFRADPTTREIFSVDELTQKSK